MMKNISSLRGGSKLKYMVIIFPLRPRASNKVIILIVVLIWIISLLSASFALKAKVITMNSTMKREIHICDFKESRETKLIREILLITFQFGLPLIVLTATYLPISIHLWRHQKIGEMNRSQVESIKMKRKVVKMNLVVVVAFIICWLPYQSFFLIFSETKHPIVPIIYMIFYWLAMMHATLNPIIYYTMNKRFRNAFNYLIRRLFCLKVDAANFQATISFAPQTTQFFSHSSVAGKNLHHLHHATHTHNHHHSHHHPHQHAHHHQHQKISKKSQLDSRAGQKNSTQSALHNDPAPLLLNAYLQSHNTLSMSHLSLNRVSECLDGQNSRAKVFV